MAAPEALDPSYTVFIRLPFPRGDFVDPPAVDWDATKDAILWKTLSKASKNSNIDWNSLAEKFEVSEPFVLQQAAWLYERQFSQLRAQMRRVGVSKSSGQSPVPGTDNTAGEAMRRTGSGGGGPRAPSSPSTRKDSPIPRNDGSISNTTVAPPLSRTSSTNTAQNRPFPQASPRLAKATLYRLSISPSTANVRSTPPPSGPGLRALSKSKNASSSDAADSSSSDSSSDSELAQSRFLRRPPRFPAHNQGRTANRDDDDEDSPAFLPFSTSGGPQGTHGDPSATLKGDPTQIARRTTPKRSTEVIRQSQTSDSSTSSTAPTTKPAPKSPSSHPPRPPVLLSPRRAAELAGRSPVGKGKNMGRDGSDGTPSMGSSFSDLDDASVTQSALEEALASNMQQGGMASRMSTISQALRSRYL